MRSRFWIVALLLTPLAADRLFALDAVGTIQKIDLDNGVLFIRSDGQDRSAKIDDAVKVLGADGAPLPDGLKAKELREGAEVTVTVESRAAGFVVTAIRLGRAVAAALEPRPSMGLKPLTEMTASDRYKGEDGGLYGAGRNEPPEGHLKAARAATAKIEPLDRTGKPARDGTIALVSISMSNATQEFSRFKQLADMDPKKSASVTIVDCAQNGQAMAEWVDPANPTWREADRRLEAAKVSPTQVQVVWVKLANVLPSGELADHGRRLEKDTIAVLQNAKARFPNLRIAYLGSRIYGGWARTPLNPEPYAYEGAFAVRWLIQDQIRGDAALNDDPNKGVVKAPLLLWGPYLWADGTTPRKSDGLVYERKDLADDGTHPSETGRRKVADLLLTFFQTDALASSWYIKK